MSVGANRWVLLFSALPVLAGCGASPKGDSWLFVVGEDTVTVSEAGEIWRKMEPSFRARLSSSDDTRGEFVVLAAKRQMVKAECERLGLYQSPPLVARAEAVYRRKAVTAARDLLGARMADSISPDDVEAFRNRIGTTVWYTLIDPVQGATSTGPVHLPEAEPELVPILENMGTGDTVELESGGLLVLDSLVRTDRELVRESLADTARIERLATSRLSSAATHRLLDSLEAQALARCSVDIDAINELAEWFSRREGSRPDVDVVSGEFLDLGSSEMVQAIRVESESKPVQPSNPGWLSFFAERAIVREALARWLQRTAQDVADSLREEADSYLARQAADSLYGIYVAERIDVDSPMVREEYELQDSLPTVPERRRFVMATVDDEHVEDIAELISTGSLDSLNEALQPLRKLSVSRTGLLTRPLRQDEIPGDHGSALFELEPEDTLGWYGPSRISDYPVSLVARLVDVLPAHESTFEEAYPTLELKVRLRLEQQRLSNWMMELEEQYGLVVNEEIVSALPEDPALW
ncbi:hypothetical protein GF402_04360 [Candidatus Fermentibacteria bacterium]|nr:hypothetical protein [Candidatus Fermentibacteria bacterium]